MSIMPIVKIGKKGEIIPPASLRKELGFVAGRKIKISVVNNKMILELIPSPIDLLRKEKALSVTLDELNQSSEEIQNEWLNETS